MKAFSAVLLISLAFTAYAGEKKMIKTWMVMKSMESCFGENMMKEYLVRCKAAMAKCAGTPTSDQLDLLGSLNPSRAGLVLAQKAHSKHQMLSNVVETHQQQSGHPAIAILPIPSQQTSEDPMMKMMKTMMMMKMMSKMMSKSDHHMKHMKHHMGFSPVDDDDEDEDDESDDAFDEQDIDMKSVMRLVRTAMSSRRQKRDHHFGQDVFELGEKLTEKLEMVKHNFEQKMGNFTCVMREFGVIDKNNDLDLDSYLEESNKITDEWLKDEMEKNGRLCYAEAESLPAEVLNDCPFGPKLGKIFHFMKCEKKRKCMSCMLNDVRKKLETNFGSLDKLVQDSGVAEKELLPMAAYMIQEQMQKGLMDDM